jgi:hypothetical protein
MNNLDYIFQIWNVLYDKKHNVKAIIENFFHDGYTQCINGVVMNRDEYINHVMEQRRNIESMEFQYKNYLSKSNELFIIYYAKGKNTQDNDIEAEIVAYFEFKDQKVFRIHGQVHLLKGEPSDVDMSTSKL